MYHNMLYHNMKELCDFVGQAQDSSKMILSSLEARQQHRGAHESTPICIDTVRKRCPKTAAGVWGRGKSRGMSLNPHQIHKPSF